MSGGCFDAKRPVLSNAIDVGIVSISCDAIVFLCEKAFKLFVIGIASIASFGHGEQFMWQHSGVAVW